MNYQLICPMAIATPIQIKRLSHLRVETSNKPKKILVMKKHKVKPMKGTKNSNFFIENFPKYKSEEIKDKSYDKQISHSRKKKKPFTPQAELDLHGKTSGEALIRLRSFIEGSRRRGLMCVLIIVGKGKRSEEGRSVLSPLVEAWFKGEGAKQISKYKNAPAKYGGSGAIAVWLKL
jgi:DNA-nicking Smr family endonuclease